MYELGGLYRLKNCGTGSFEDLDMIVHLVLDHSTSPGWGVRGVDGPESG